MQTNALFYAIYSVLAILTNLFLPLSTLLGIALASALTVFIPVVLVGHNQKSFKSIRKNWVSSLGCSLVLGIIFTVVFTAKMYLLTIVISITGAPYHVPAVDFERIFLLCLGTASIASAGVFFAYDGFKHMRRQSAQVKGVPDANPAVLGTKPDPDTQSDA